VVVVDGGSKDGTVNSAHARSSFFNNFKILKNVANKDKGYSVKRGVLSAEGEYVLFMDADSSASIYEFDKFLPLLEEGCEAVIASNNA